LKKQEDIHNNHITARLTALWALSETGLGGVMHALNLPFTGILLGGFAIAVVYLMAVHSTHPGRAIFRATLIVLAVKAAVSPHSPFGAYFAVGFQGFTGALLYGWTKGSQVMKFILPFHAILTQLMSATQKVFILTLYYGMAFWDSVDALFQKIMTDMTEISGVSASKWMIGAYMLLHFTTALVVTFFVLRWQAKFNVFESEKIDFSLEIPNSDPQKRRKGKYRHYLFIVLMLLFVFIVQTWVLDRPDQAVWILIRSVAIIALMYGLVLPGLKYVSKRWIQKRSTDLNEAIAQTSLLLPKLRPLARYAWQKSKGEKIRVLWFFEYLLILGITAQIHDKSTSDR
jgi:hypothetical protein